MRWDAMDAELLRRYWTRHAAERASAADICERVLVFHRGISNVRCSSTVSRGCFVELQAGRSGTRLLAKCVHID